MAKKEPASTFDVFQDIEFIFGVLPSLDLRNELVASFNKVIGFLGEMLAALEKIPTRDEMIERGIPEAIDCLKRFFQNLQKIGEVDSRQRKPRGIKKEFDVEAFVKQLSNISGEQIESALRDSGLTVSQLKEVLTYIGGSTRGASRKDQVIQRIVDEIRTRRNLSGLRDGATP